MESLNNLQLDYFLITRKTFSLFLMFSNKSKLISVMAKRQSYMHSALKDSSLDKNIRKLKEWNGIVLLSLNEDEASVSLTEKCELGAVFQCWNDFALYLSPLFPLFIHLLINNEQLWDKWLWAQLYKVVNLFLNYVKSLCPTWSPVSDFMSSGHRVNRTIS